MNITISNSVLKAVINRRGAELVSLSTISGKEYIWEGDPKFWGKHSPVLFPIIGELKNGHYHYKDQKYSLPRHGFAREMTFQVHEKNDSSVTFSLKSNAETLHKYPFEFELKLIYTLDKNKLRISYSVENKGNDEMFFSIGGHPAFAVPGNFEDYEIDFRSGETREYSLLENNLISDQTKKLGTDQNGILKIDYQLFANDALVFKNPETDKIRILNEGKPYLEVDFNGFPNLGIWTVPGAPFLCVEPWCGYADTIHSDGEISGKEGINSLKAGADFRRSFTVEIF